MRLVGLTGGIACGKSTASALMQQSGLAIIDCDKLAKEAVQRGTWGHRRVVKAFGDGLLLNSGEVNREALGELVFKDPVARRRLNAATHLPVLLAILRQLFTHWVSCTPVVVIDMPLLFETGFFRVTRRRVLVACSPSVQRERLVRRDQLSQAAAEARMASQMPLERKRHLANIVIENDGTLEELQSDIAGLTARLKSGAWLHRWVLSPVGLTVGLAAAAWLALGR